VNNGEREIDELSKSSTPSSRSPEEQRIRFHRLVKRVSDAILAQGFISSEYIRATEAEKAKVFFKVTEEGECVLADARAKAGSAEAAERKRDSAQPQ